MKITTVALVLLCLLSIAVHGDDYADASIAYDKKEYTKALRLYNQACENGDAGGCTMVGAIYIDGNIVEKNIDKGMFYYSKACDMGYEYGCELYTKQQAKLPICTEEEISFINDKRYFYVGGNDYFSGIFADTKTITIDKKNKIIKVWTTWLVTENGRQSRIESMGKYDDYSTYGYQKYLDLINYGNRKSKGNASNSYNCDGKAVFLNDLKDDWKDITPGSTMEAIMESIMTKYNLK